MQFFNELLFNFWYWWYYQAFKDFLNKIWSYVFRVANFTGFNTHLRYLFVPIYQQYNIGGRIFSFIFRLGVVFLGGSLTFAVAALSLLVISFYLILPLTPLIKIWLAILL
jgi:hypothetical protein